MAIEIFNTPDKEIPLPTWNSTLEQDEEYKKKLVQLLNKKGFNQPDTGFILRFPVGDGYAEYMVISTDKPRIMHLPLGDAWEYPIHKYTTKAFKDEIRIQRAWNKTMDSMRKGGDNA